MQRKTGRAIQRMDGKINASLLVLCSQKPNGTTEQGKYQLASTIHFRSLNGRLIGDRATFSSYTCLDGREKPNPLMDAWLSLLQQ